MKNSNVNNNLITVSREQGKRHYDYFSRLDIDGSLGWNESLEDLIVWEENEGEVMTFDTFKERFEIRK